MNHKFEIEIVNKVGDLLAPKPTSKDIKEIISGYISPGADVSVIKQFFPLPNIRKYTFDFKGILKNGYAIFVNDGKYKYGITLNEIEIDYGNTNK